MGSTEVVQLAQTPGTVPSLPSPSCRADRAHAAARPHREHWPWHGQDSERFHKAVRPHLDRALAVGRRMLGSDDLAWDALQEALLCLARRPEEPANLAAWLARATANRSLHLQRVRSRRRRHEQEAAT